jgi:hypothetical protein
MANEVQSNLTSIVLLKGVYNDVINFSAALGWDITNANANIIHETQSFGTGGAVANKGNLGTIGWFCIHNTDPTNDLLYSPGTTDFFTIKPGKYAIGYANVSSISMKSSAANVRGEFWFADV